MGSDAKEPNRGSNHGRDFDSSRLQKEVEAVPWAGQRSRSQRRAPLLSGQPLDVARAFAGH